MEWGNNFPNWEDDGRAIKARSERIPELAGTLYYDDFDCDENGDEWPRWRIKKSNGENYSLFEFDEWKLN